MNEEQGRLNPNNVCFAAFDMKIVRVMNKRVNGTFKTLNKKYKKILIALRKFKKLSAMIILNILLVTMSKVNFQHCSCL